MVMLVCGTRVVQGQQSGEPLIVTLDLQSATKSELMTKLGEACDCPVYDGATSLELAPTTVAFRDVPLDSVLEALFENTAIGYLLYDQQVIVLGERSTIEENYTPQFYQALEESLTIAKDPQEVVQVIGSIDAVSATGVTRLTGQVVDGESNEPIIGATIITKEDGQGTATDEAGNYMLELKPGSYTLAVQYIGFRNREIPISVISSGELDIRLLKGSILLDEVVVEAQKRDENVQSAQTGVTRISTKEIEKLPNFLGEVDVIKSLLLQPGVSSIGEGSSGFNVRGGNVDQNLIIIDEAMLFNSSHALGFFSAFNSDIVSDATLYKANIPARFGGRLSSVLSVNVRDGNFDKIRFKGGLGVISSRFTLEGPIKEKKTSFLISGRSTYSDWVLKSINLAELKRSSAFFYDANLQLTHRFNERNFLSISSYRSEDDFVYNSQFGFDYQTTIGQLTYQSLIGKNVLSTFSAVYSEYQSNQKEFDPIFASRLSISNGYWKFKENVNLSSESFNMDVGFSTIIYDINPGNLVTTSPESTIIPGSVEDEKGVESAGYLTMSYDISPRLTLDGGLRYSFYQYKGPRERFTYENPSRPREEEIIDRVLFTDKNLYTKGVLEPRLSGRFRLDAEASVKFGYSRTSQFINQISNNETPTPTNLWQLSNEYIEPQLSHNFSLGYFRNFDQNIWITSIDFFYRNIDQLFDYKDFADFGYQ